MRCKTVNQTTNRFCKTCGFALESDIAGQLIKDEEEVKNTHNLMEELIKDPEVVQLLCQKMRERGLMQN